MVKQNFGFSDEFLHGRSRAFKAFKGFDKTPLTGVKPRATSRKKSGAKKGKS